MQIYRERISEIETGLDKQPHEVRLFENKFTLQFCHTTGRACYDPERIHTITALGSSL